MIIFLMFRYLIYSFSLILSHCEKYLFLIILWIWILAKNVTKYFNCKVTYFIQEII